MRVVSAPLLSSLQKGALVVVDRAEQELRDFIRSPFYDSWRTKIQATGGCLHPIRLAGTYQLRTKNTGQVVHDHSGQIMAPCGTRRESLCPSCSRRYAQDAFHLIRAGLTGDDSKGVDKSVASAPRVFATFTAPSFGPVHTRRVSRRGLVIPCGCGEKHGVDDTRIGGALDPDSYDYEGAVIWQACAGTLWQRTAIRIRRCLARLAGVRVRDLKDIAKVSYSKVAEYQKRGLVHFHAVIRLDVVIDSGMEWPWWATTDILREAVALGIAEAKVESWRPTGEVLPVVWGKPDIRDITNHDNDRDSTGMSGSRLAGYIAKYATKDSGATASGVDRPIKSREHITMMSGISTHHRRMMATAWDLGGLEAYEDFGLRRWAHKLGFRGHFLTKSGAYSTTFKALRLARQEHRLAELIESLDVDQDEIVVVNAWEFAGVGHKSDAEYELAQAIAERNMQQRQSFRE